MLKKYYELAKPGMVYGNLIPLIAGFVLAAHANIYWPLFLATIIGTSLVIASGCVFNNYLDRDYDVNMPRTKNRALVTGEISGPSALTYGSALGVIGFTLLFFFTNVLALAAAAAGFFFYVVMYSWWFKRKSPWGAFIGAIAGATPPVIGYCAASGHFDSAAVILFFILFIWQMPHFYAIAIRRLDEYAAAKFPVLPVVRGVRSTKIRMLMYLTVFVFLAPMLAVFGYAGPVYFFVALILSVLWLGLCAKGLFIDDKEKNTRWARIMFLFSLVVLMVLFVTLAIGALV